MPTFASDAFAKVLFSACAAPQRRAAGIWRHGGVFLV